ncbi:MAG: hypothetical protein AMS18_01515 [Gemmatimonas sp. SG8_17]|nr:MAG: hypothetical protein AMS18_01515 [Gemmatimonas sp. SG8_17]
MASAAVVIGVVCPNDAKAQALYYRTIPLGQRAIGLATAYTGISDDPSATYYNPGGLTTGGRFQFLGSLSSIVFTRQKIEGAFDSPDIDRDLLSKSSSTLPYFVGTVVKFGKKTFGDHRFAIAYSSFEVARERFNVGFSEIRPESSGDLRLSSDYGMRWYGVSFAMQATKNVSLGITAFLADQSFGYGEELGLANGGMLEADVLRVGGDSVSSSTDIGIQAYSFVFRLGALYRINRRWQIGFMFQPPGAPIKQTGSVFRRFVTSLEGTEPSYFLFDEGDLSVRAPIPFELRTGVEYKINATSTLSVDAAITGGIRDRQVFTRPSEIAAAGPRLGAYFSNSTERRWTPNFAIGAEHLFGKLVVAGGLSTNFSAAPNVPETTTEYTPDQVSIYGASVSIGVDTGGYRFTVGASGYFGRGDALSFTLDREARVTFYEREQSNFSALLAYIAGAVQIASKGTKDAKEKIQNHKTKSARDVEPEAREQEEESPSSDRQ